MSLRSLAFTTVVEAADIVSQGSGEEVFNAVKEDFNKQLVTLEKAKRVTGEILKKGMALAAKSSRLEAALHTLHEGHKAASVSINELTWIHDFRVFQDGSALTIDPLKETIEVAKTCHGGLMMDAKIVKALRPVARPLGVV